MELALRLSYEDKNEEQDDSVDARRSRDLIVKQLSFLDTLDSNANVLPFNFVSTIQKSVGIMKSLLTLKGTSLGVAFIG